MKVSVPTGFMGTKNPDVYSQTFTVPEGVTVLKLETLSSTLSPKYIGVTPGKSYTLEKRTDTSSTGFSVVNVNSKINWLSIQCRPQQASMFYSWIILGVSYSPEINTNKPPTILDY